MVATTLEKKGTGARGYSFVKLADVAGFYLGIGDKAELVVGAVEKLTIFEFLHLLSGYKMHDVLFQVVV